MLMMVLHTSIICDLEDKLTKPNKTKEKKRLYKEKNDSAFIYMKSHRLTRKNGVFGLYLSKSHAFNFNKICFLILFVVAVVRLTLSGGKC